MNTPEVITITATLAECVMMYEEHFNKKAPGNFTYKRLMGLVMKATSPEHVIRDLDIMRTDGYADRYKTGDFHGFCAIHCEKDGWGIESI